MQVLEYHATPTNNDSTSTKVNSDLSQQDPNNTSTLIDMMHVPWNPADVNTVQGRYASPYPSTSATTGGSTSSITPTSTIPNSASHYFLDRTVAGSEGWGRVVASSTLPIGSLITVGVPGLGTLRSSLRVSSDHVLSVPEELWELLGPAGSTLFQLGGTAWRLLTDFVPLQPGHVVLQNVGNSGVGVMVSQLSSMATSTTIESSPSSSIPTVSLVRRGTKSIQEMEQLFEYLIGTAKNALVLVEEDFHDDNHDPDYLRQVQGQLRDLSNTGQLPQLALNAVGGQSAKTLLRLLDQDGTMVTYGGMSGQPVTIGTPQLIFKNVRIMGYWHSRWMVQQSLLDKQGLVDTLAKAVLMQGVTCPPCQVFSLSQVQEALQWQADQKDPIRSKLVFDCRP